MRPGGQFEGAGNTDGFDGHVEAETAGSSLTAASASWRELLTVTSAPNCLAASSRPSDRSMATMRLGLEARADHRGQPDWAGADDRYHVGRLHPSVEHADLVAGGKDISQHQDLFIGHPLGTR